MGILQSQKNNMTCVKYPRGEITFFMSLVTENYVKEITPLFVYLYTDFWTNKISLISPRFEALKYNVKSKTAITSSKPMNQTSLLTWLYIMRIPVKWRVFVWKTKKSWNNVRSRSSVQKVQVSNFITWMWKKLKSDNLTISTEQNEEC